MAEDGGMVNGGHGGHGGDHSVDHDTVQRPSRIEIPLEAMTSPMSPRANTPNPFSRKNTSLDLDDYFTGPRDIQKHSKWPMFLQLHGSILPKMIIPLIVVGGWATCITCISDPNLGNNPLGVDPLLLTVLGFVVGLGLSFRSSTAYERYAEGRRYWAQLIMASQNLGRGIWIHANEREGDLGKKDVLAKLTALNLVTAFAVALKHKLRFEPYTGYDDMVNLVGHLDTLAGAATQAEPEKVARRKTNPVKATGEYLGVSFAASNPRKAIKKAGRPLGNLPLEILNYLAAYTDEIVGNGQLPVPMTQTLMYNNIALLNDILTGTERVLTTPLPLAFSICIAQITYVYIFMLPFQLWAKLNWVTIPATIFAAYIILGILFIGREIENPFGQDVNDLPLESYCAQIAAELDVIASRPKPKSRDWIETLDNKVLFPLSQSGWPLWMHRGEVRIREAIVAKTELGFEMRKEMMGQEDGKNEGGDLVKSRSKERANGQTVDESQV